MKNCKTMSEKFDRTVKFIKECVPATEKLTFTETNEREYMIDCKKWTITLFPADCDLKIDAKTTLDYLDVIYFGNLTRLLLHIRDKVYDARDEVF